MLTVADTAFPIAAVRAEEGERPAGARLFEDPYASIFVAAGAHAEEGTKRFLGLPFFRDGIRLRTRFIDDFVRDGLAAGITQVVLLGAGFDMRALRIPEIAARGASVYEVDFAEQLEKKRALCVGASVALPAWIAHVPCDFAAPDLEATLTAALEERGFRRGAGALFIWEGVTAYIDDDAIDRSLTFMTRAGGPGSRVVFEFAHGRFERVSITERTRRAGFSAWEELGFDDLWRRYLEGEPHENAWVCRIGAASV